MRHTGSATPRPAFNDAVGQRVVVAEERRQFGAERGSRGAGQRREIDDQARIGLARERKRVAQHEPPLSVGVVDLDGGAFARCE